MDHHHLGHDLRIQRHRQPAGLLRRQHQYNYLTRAFLLCLSSRRLSEQDHHFPRRKQLRPDQHHVAGRNVHLKRKQPNQVQHHLIQHRDPDAKRRAEPRLDLVGPNGRPALRQPQNRPRHPKQRVPAHRCAGEGLCSAQRQRLGRHPRHPPRGPDVQDLFADRVGVHAHRSAVHSPRHPNRRLHLVWLCRRAAHRHRHRPRQLRARRRRRDHLTPWRCHL